MPFEENDLQFDFVVHELYEHIPETLMVLGFLGMTPMMLHTLALDMEKQRATCGDCLDCIKISARTIEMVKNDVDGAVR